MPVAGLTVQGASPVVDRRRGGSVRGCRGNAADLTSMPTVPAGPIHDLIRPSILPATAPCRSAAGGNGVDAAKPDGRPM